MQHKIINGLLFSGLIMNMFIFFLIFFANYNFITFRDKPYYYGEETIILSGRFDQVVCNEDLQPNDVELTNEIYTKVNLTRNILGSASLSPSDELAEAAKCIAKSDYQKSHRDITRKFIATLRPEHYFLVNTGYLVSSSTDVDEIVSSWANQFSKNGFLADAQEMGVGYFHDGSQTNYIFIFLNKLISYSDIRKNDRDITLNIELNDSIINDNPTITLKRYSRGLLHNVVEESTDLYLAPTKEKQKITLNIPKGDWGIAELYLNGSAITPGQIFRNE